MGNLKRVSATQVQDFALCARKWYIANVLKERPAPGESLRIGTEVHSALEAYLPSGNIPDGPWSAHVAAAAPYLPKAPCSPTVHVERWIELPTYNGGPPWVGKVDVIDATDHILHVYDHKTSKALKFKLTVETIGQNIQMAAYGKFALTTPIFGSRSKDRVKLTHTYIRVTEKPKIEQVSSIVTREQIDDTWNQGLGHVRDMEKTAPLPSWQEVTPNTSSCNAYGGCPYREKCGFTNIVEQLKGGDGMSSSLLDRLKKARGLHPDQEVNLSMSNGDKEIRISPIGPIIPPDVPSRTSTPEEVAEASKPKGKKAKTTENAPALSHSGYTLYVDCYPTRGNSAQPVPFGDLLAPVLDKVAKEAGVADPRFIKFDAKARIAVELRTLLSGFPPHIVVSSMGTYADVFLEVAGPGALNEICALKGLV